MIENLVLTNKITGAKIDLSMSNEDFVLESADFGSIKGSHQTYHYPTQKGYTKYSSTLETREPKIIGWVIGKDENDIAMRKTELNSLVNPLEDILIGVEKEYYITLTPSSTVRYSTNYSENNDVMCKFSIEGTCYNPLFISEDKKEVAAGTEGAFMFPLIIPEEGYIFSTKKSSLICTIENDGTIESGIQIVFKANGTVVNPSLTSVKTQECFKINKTLEADEVVVVDTNIGKRAVKGFLNGDEFNYFKYRDFDNGDWISLKKGVNLYRYDAEDGLDNLDVSILYNKAWLEVDN